MAVRLASRVERSTRRPLGRPSRRGSEGRHGRAGAGRGREHGRASLGAGTFLSYHWLDSRDNPIVWDGIRTDAPPLTPGERATVVAQVRAPIPPGRTASPSTWWPSCARGSRSSAARCSPQDVDVGERPGEPNAPLPDGFVRAPDWQERVRAAHAEGYGVVAGAIDWPSGLFQRRPRELAPYAPGPGRVPGFSAALLAPSVLAGISLEPLGELAGLPAFAAPRDEPWLYDGRIVLRHRP